MKPKEFSAIDPERLSAHMPSGHPAVEDSRLTLFQQQALPTLLWFFDQQRNRATGRSHLMAHILIELAKRGEEVVLQDLSTAPEFGRGQNYSRTRRFADDVLRLTRSVYFEDYFSYNHQTNTMVYRGRRP